MKNIVDSCGWLEYFANAHNASLFEPILLDTNNLIVPKITIYEVTRRLLVVQNEHIAHNALLGMSQAHVCSLSETELFAAAKAAHQYKLAMADAIIWQTAQTHNATLYTQDADLKHLPDVVYFEKSD